jgi:Zn-dependent peptidase ImmA (M78 family)
MRQPKPDRAERELKLRGIRADAQKQLAELDMRRPEDIDLLAIAKRLRANVKIAPLDGATARVIRIGPTARIVITNRLNDPGAIRFSIAHELAHVRLDHDFSVDSASGALERICHPLRADHRGSEREASVHATETLMPEPMVRPLCAVPHVTLEPARAIAKTFTTSLLASAMRLVELSDQRCAIVYSELGRVKWVKPSATFPAWIPRGRRLHPTSAAFEYSQRGRIDPAPHVLFAGAWLPEMRIDSTNVEIVEHSAVVPELGAVFSLLWIPDREAKYLDLAA